MINTWNESLLHEELKLQYGSEADSLEAAVEGSICDILHADGSVTEIQTAHLGKLKPKLEKLIKNHEIRIVYPIAKTLRLETRDCEGMLISSRKSPKKGSVYQIFPEITGIYHLLGTGKLRIEIVFADVTEFRVADGSGSWRRKGVRIENRKLDQLLERLLIRSGNDLLDLLPDGLPDAFTTKDLKQRGVGRHAGHMVWVLVKLRLIEKIGSKDRCYLYKLLEA